eukprot:TRINITY_DN8316_c0_g1_i1.p1 TRINITY_DN8316_c0_g1~~TRINITY_DN8316_c0_g1_i1.p1  ORF type:complete len:294 (+),score=75.82 TRINITY_DN8316_c0_g1_i1:261-1142(+)
MEELKSLHSNLNKKQSFIPATQRLREIVESLDSPSKDLTEAIFSALSRVNVLIRTRYSEQRFIKPSFDLFQAASRASKSSSIFSAKEQASKISDWLKTSGELLSDADLKNGECPADQVHHQTGNPFVETDSYGAPQNSNPTATPLQNLPPINNIADLQSFIRSIMSDVSIEQLMGNMDANAANIPEGFGSDYSESGPPPASRDARFNLPVKTVGASDLQCIVCMEEFERTSKAKQLPCGHLFHFDCILEWLERHNTCPMCRESLPSEKRSFDDVAEKIEKRSQSEVLTTGLYS